MLFNPGIKPNKKVIFVLPRIAFLMITAICASSQQLNKMTTKDDRSGVYRVQMLQISPPEFAVTAHLPINGKALKMERTRPGDVPEVGTKGWPALIRNLQVKDGKNQPVEVKSIGPAGWELTESKAERLTIEYEIDYSLLAKNNFPAPREAAFADSDHFIAVGRSFFITTPDVRSMTVNFKLPPGWNAITPWTQITKPNNLFSVTDTKDLTENFVVLSRIKTEVISAGGFRLFTTALGSWQKIEAEVKQVLQKVVPFLVKFMGTKEKTNYSLILLPMLEDENAGESYRGSFLFTAKMPPSRATRPTWGQIIGHEIFHYWNGWRLQGADYASSQWFQEGFTQYVADLVMVNSGITSPDEFRQRIAEHIKNYQKLTTTLEAPGTHKGPPLYSGGALVALCWDLQIRHATKGKRNLGDFLRTLWQQTNRGQRQYEWKDIQTALNSTASFDWEAFFLAHIRGQEKLPLDKALSQAGLQLGKGSDGAPEVEIMTGATSFSKSLWTALIKGQ